VTLTVTDNQGGWARDSHLVTIEPSPPPNATPTASFTLSCSGPSCRFDAGASHDSDGSIEAYSWDLGDGTTGSGKTAQHDYAKEGTYTVRLTVADNGGATDAASRNLTLISLNARGYKHKGLQKVDLSWSGPSGASFDVYRDAGKITTVQASSYTDNIDQKGQGSYVYKICEAGTATCSNPARVTF
jgi:serine protease